MSDVPDYSCFLQLGEQHCPSCILDGGEFFRMFNNSYCCTYDLSAVSGGIVSVIRNVTACPVITNNNGQNADDGSGVFGLALLLSSAAIGAACAGGIFVAGCCLWRCILKCWGSRRRRRGNSGRSANSATLTTADIETTPLLTNPSAATAGNAAPSRERENDSMAREAATLLNNQNPVVSAEGNLRPEQTTPAARGLQSSYGSIASARGVGDSENVDEEPLYDEVLLVEEPRACVIPSTGRLPLAPPRERVGPINQRRRLNESPYNLPSRNYNDVAVITTVGMAAGNDDDDDAEDERLLQKLRMWGKAGKVRVVKKRSDTTSLSEWETDF